ncbi:hypothetical protein CRUP_007868 [Coryphaenoides rupestris]|nr:hypothetical protein CRUP_007868 [Coryphaenoides rupestris]
MTAPAATSQQWIPISKKASTAPEATRHMLVAAVPDPRILTPGEEGARASGPALSGACGYKAPFPFLAEYILSSMQLYTTPNSSCKTQAGRCFIGEESVAAGLPCILTDNPTWIIDPVDGTTNFVHGGKSTSTALHISSPWGSQVKPMTQRNH